MRYINLLIIIFIANFAQAGVLGNSFFIEPYAGYRSETLKLTDLLNVTSEIKTSQPNFGLKLGYRSLLGIDINLAGEYHSGNANILNQLQTFKYSHKSAAVQLGVNALGLIKMYLGSSFINEFNMEESAISQSYKISGPSFHTGLQFKMIPFVSIGLQYNLNQFNSIEGAAYTNGNKLETYFNKIDTQDYSVYLSTTF